MELNQGASINNFYWMEGPLSGDVSARVTVLHPGQPQQCSHCLKTEVLGCPGKGNGKACEALGTERTKMNVYMELVKHKHKYESLKAKYFAQFPTLGGVSEGSNNLDMTESDEHPDTMRIEECENEALKKMKDDLNVVKRKDALARNKLE